MAHCNRCNRQLEKGERRSDHVCDTIAVEEDGHTTVMHSSRLNTDADLQRKLDAKEAKVVGRARLDPVKSITDKFKKYKQDESGAVLLEGDPNQ